MRLRSEHHDDRNNRFNAPRGYNENGRTPDVDTRASRTRYSSDSFDEDRYGRDNPDNRDREFRAQQSEMDHGRERNGYDGDTDGWNGIRDGRQFDDRPYNDRQYENRPTFNRGWDDRDFDGRSRRNMSQDGMWPDQSYDRANTRNFADRNVTDGRNDHAGKGPKGWKRSDQQIHDEVSEALARHPGIDASDIEIEVSNGEVTLSGTVSDRSHKRMAEDVAEEVFGANDVQNQIKVKRESRTDTKASDANMSRADANDAKGRKAASKDTAANQSNSHTTAGVGA